MERAVATAVAWWVEKLRMGGTCTEAQLEIFAQQLETEMWREHRDPDGDGTVWVENGYVPDKALRHAAEVADIYPLEGKIPEHIYMTITPTPGKVTVGNGLGDPPEEIPLLGS